MNVRKRGLALLMCICMIFTLLPFSAFADASSDDSVVYGQYDNNGKWKQVANAKDTVTYPVDNQGNTVTLKKTATPTGNKNEYKIDLEVITTETSSTKAGDAATVLVIDVSGSMGDCATCGWRTSLRMAMPSKAVSPQHRPQQSSSLMRLRATAQNAMFPL